MIRRRPLAAAIVTWLIAAGCSQPSGAQPSRTIMDVAPTPPSTSPGVTTATAPTPDSPAAATEHPVSKPMTLTSPDFEDDGPIPKRFTCDGQDVSPSLAWSGVPEAARSLALIVTDPDAHEFVHWVAYDIDPSATGALQAGWSTTAGAAPQGRNSFGKIGYGGPCPPSGTHHYAFRLLALDAGLNLPAGSSADDVLARSNGHTIARATLTGTYRRG